MPRKQQPAGMNNRKFRNLNLFTIRHPFTSIISILHRVSGIFIYLLIPFLLWLLDIGTASSDGFKQSQLVLVNPVSKIFLWLVLAALGYHLLAGIRHLLMDMGAGESLTSARISGAITLLLAIIWAAAAGVWLW